MGRLNFFIILLGSAIFSACSSTGPLVDSNWQDKPITVDGKASEWSIPLQYYDAKTKLNFTITNDDSNLYYCFRITDDKEELRVLRAGMQFWIDTTGKNQQQVGIQFPFPELSGGNMPGGEKGNHGKKNHSGDSGSSEGGARKGNNFSTPQKQMRLSGFMYPIAAGITPISNTYGIKVSIAHDSSGVTIYEACVPFRTFYKSVLGPRDNGKLLGITIILNAMASGEHAGGHHGGGGRGHGGDIGGMGGSGGLGGQMGMHAAGMGGVGGGGGMGGTGSRTYSGGDEDEETSTSTTLKVRIKLSAK